MVGRNKQGVWMQLRFVILYVADVRATMDFYARAFGLQTRFLHEGGDYGEMETGATRLAFSAIALMESMGKQVATSPPERPAFELAFTTDDVPAGLDRALAAGAVLVQGATEMPWGQTLSYVRAPEGTLVEICTPTP
jgi:catechol 2,3-dioxygenase-like lactoylglutathione lyase family enzyme